jgi:hypothetical protein
MRSALIGSVTGAFLLLLSTAAYADPPPGVGAAITDSGFDCFLAVVVEGDGLAGPVDEILPGGSGGFGIVSTPIVENTKSVDVKSANGNLTLSCHGKIEFGSQIAGFNFFPLGGGTDVPTATVAQFDEACGAISGMFPDACNGEGAAVLNFENTGLPCEIVPFLPTFDWQYVMTRSGRVVLQCLYKEQ